MIDLKLIINKYSDCLSSRNAFRSVLMDIYPNEKQTVNILASILECGIVQKIKSKPVLEDNEFRALLLSLENDYGISPQYSVDSLKLWADAYGVKVQAIINKASFSTNSEPTEEPTIVENVIIKGCESDYETEVLESGSLMIKRFIGFGEKEMTIPNQIDGRAVTVIGENAFANCKEIEKLNISEGIVVIENGAFCGCEALKTVSLPNTLKKLGNEPRMTIPIHSWESPKEIEYNGVFQETAIESIVLPKGLTFLGGKAFSFCKQLTDINIPKGIRVIPNSCFHVCVKLKTIDIPPSCKVIERFAFSGCKNLSQVSLHEGLEKIDYHVFESCISLSSIIIPSSVKEFGEGIFSFAGRDNRVIYCYAGSCGLEYARKEGFQVRNAANQRR